MSERQQSTETVNPANCTLRNNSVTTWVSAHCKTRNCLRLWNTPAGYSIQCFCQLYVYNDWKIVVCSVPKTNLITTCLPFESAHCSLMLQSVHFSRYLLRMGPECSSLTDHVISHMITWPKLFIGYLISSVFFSERPTDHITKSHKPITWFRHRAYSHLIYDLTWHRTDHSLVTLVPSCH